MRIRRLKDKLGTRSVATGVEFVAAEGFLLTGEPSGDAGPVVGKGLGRMIELTNAARLGIALYAIKSGRWSSAVLARERRVSTIDPLPRRPTSENTDVKPASS